MNRKTLRRVGAGLSLAAAVAGLAVLAFLALEVARKLSLLETASSDNVQWTLSQAEVEFLELQTAVAEGVHGGAPDLAFIRREFDIFYSRIDTLITSPLYNALAEDARYAAALGTAEGFLEAAVPIIDAKDADLVAQLPDLSLLIVETRPAVRALSVAGLEYFARAADLRRQAVAQTLTRLAAATVALLSILMVAALGLARLVRIGERRTQDIQLASARLGTIVSTSLDAIVVADRTGRIVEFNPAAERIFGYARDEALGQPMGDLIVPAKHRAAHEAGMERYRRTGTRHVIGKGRIKLEAQRRTGALFPVELAIESAEGAIGEIFISFLRDISHRVAAEQELVRARDQAVAGEKAKTEFLAVMSHEIRTPLSGLLGTLSLLKDTRLTNRQKGYVENMETSGALLMHHVNDVLDISKYEAGKLVPDMEPVDLNALVQSVVDNQRDLGSAAHNVLDWRWVGAPMPWVRTDPLRLRQVLMNLVGNAVKFTRNGRITVELEAGAKDDASLTPVTFRVIDTGIGIAPSAIERLFRDFETGDSSYGRKAGGTGLGLGIARRLTKALGGEIGARSTPGEGSVFWLCLPMQPAEPASARDRAAEPSEPAGPTIRRKILIVEDNEINRTVLREMLVADGHHVVEAHDGRDGVQRAATEAFDLVLMDISMPVMDGREATRAIREGGGRSSSAEIVAVTAHALPTEIEDFRKHGIDAYLRKPIQRAELRALLSRTGALANNVRPSPAALELDAAHLAELRAALGAESAAALLSRFIAEGDEAVAKISDTSNPAWCIEETRQLAHRFAGSAATFGATALRSGLVEIQDLADAGREAAVKRRSAELVARWERVRALLAQTDQSGTA